MPWAIQKLSGTHLPPLGFKLTSCDTYGSLLLILSIRRCRSYCSRIDGAGQYSISLSHTTFDDSSCVVAARRTNFVNESEIVIASNQWSSGNSIPAIAFAWLQRTVHAGTLSDPLNEPRHISLLHRLLSKVFPSLYLAINLLMISLMRIFTAREPGSENVISENDTLSENACTHAFAPSALGTPSSPLSVKSSSHAFWGNAIRNRNAEFGLACSWLMWLNAHAMNAFVLTLSEASPR